MDCEKYIGLDVHQATISVAVMDSSGKVAAQDVEIGEPLRRDSF